MTQKITPAIELMAAEFSLRNEVADRPCSEGRTVPTPGSHTTCMVCGNNHSLGVHFHVSGGEVATTVALRDEWQGYAGVMHGGMIATLLDAAMTHCLFHHHVEAMTADLQVRYLEPIECIGTIDIAARLLGHRRLIYDLSAELRVAGHIKARATAKFMQHKALPEQCRANTASHHST